MSWNLTPKVMAWGDVTLWRWLRHEAGALVMGLESLQTVPQRDAGPFPHRQQCDCLGSKLSPDRIYRHLSLGLPSLQNWDKQVSVVEKPLHLWYFCYSTKTLIITQFAEMRRVLRETRSGYSTWPGWGEVQVRVLREANCWAVLVNGYGIPSQRHVGRRPPGRRNSKGKGTGCDIAGVIGNSANLDCRRSIKYETRVRQERASKLGERGHFIKLWDLDIILLMIPTQ